MNAQDLAKRIMDFVPEAQKESGKQFTVLVSVVDEVGAASLLHISQEIEEAVPGHCETALVTLTGVFYKQMLDQYARVITPDSGDDDRTLN